VTERPLVFRAEAVTELLAARRWYDRQRTGLGDVFAMAVERTVELIREHPETYPLAHGSIRRLMVRRFPYGVFYRVTATEVVVLSVSHLHRDPRRWRSRS
jgi:plasmid stabilization system protein ParE